MSATKRGKQKQQAEVSEEEDRNICKRVAWATEQRSETNHSGHLKLKSLSKAE